MKFVLRVTQFIFFLPAFLIGQIDSVNINGLSLVSVNAPLETGQLDPVLGVNANWVAIIPFGFMPQIDAPKLVYNNEWQWYGERLDGAKQAVETAHSRGLNVMLKPQLWVGHGAYTGHVKMNTDQDWDSLEVNYRKFILDFASMAEDTRVEMLCIGTELGQFVEARPLFWEQLCQEIRNVYSGKLTYAANWDDFDQVTLWKQLDYIGVDAYFPIASGDRPSPKTLCAGWERHIAQMDSVGRKFDKKVLFTEFGYRSISDCAEKPWDYSDHAEVDERAQSFALEALFRETWNHPRFAGGFLWKWYPEHHSAGGHKDATFAIQNKLAEKVVRKYYGIQSTNNEE